MKQERHFENIRGRSADEAERIETVIADLRRIVQALECHVAAETERSRIGGHSDIQSSSLASALAARRDNLKSTIATLETRLPKSPVMVAPV